MNGTRPIRGAALFLFLALFSGARADKIAEQIQASEYQISWDAEKTAYQALNRAHGFRTYFQAQGIVAVPREEAEPSWQWGLTWIAYGRGEASRPVPAANVESSEGRVDYRRGRLLEWYENTPAGLKQGFVLASPPEELLGGVAGDGRARGLLHLDLALTGELSAVVSEDSQAIDFVTGDGTRVLRYAALKVTDARGHEVPSRMEAFVRGDVRIVRLVVDASAATLLIDAERADLDVESDKASAALGASVARPAIKETGTPTSSWCVFYDNGETTRGPSSSCGSRGGRGSTTKAVRSRGRAWPRRGRNGDGYGDVIVGVSATTIPRTARAGRTFSSALDGHLPHPLDVGEQHRGDLLRILGGRRGDVTATGTGMSSLAATPAHGRTSFSARLLVWPRADQTFTGARGATGEHRGHRGGRERRRVRRRPRRRKQLRNGQTAEGAAYVYHGSALGIPRSPPGPTRAITRAPTDLRWDRGRPQWRRLRRHRPGGQPYGDG